MMEHMKSRFSRVVGLPVLWLSVAGALNAQAKFTPVDVTTTASVDYTPGAVIHIEGTVGELNVEAWDRPRVEATLTRTQYTKEKDRDDEKQRLEKIGISVKEEEGEIAIAEQIPKRHFWGRLARGKTDAALTCRVMVPRDAKIEVRHQNGSVTLYGMAGDVDATAQFGSIVVQLADPAKYSLDVRTRAGGVYTEYPRQKKKAPKEVVSSGAPGAHTVRVRVAIGTIDIVKMGPVAATGY
jgi:hypothetical protein